MRTLVWGLSLAVTLSFAVATSANAAVVTLGSSNFADAPTGPGVATFDTQTPVNINDTSPDPAGPFTEGPGSWSGTGIIAQGTTAGYYAAPFGDATPYFAMLANPDLGPETLTLSAAATQLSLFWGSVDSYNVIEFLLGGTLVDMVSGNDVFNPASGDQTSANTNRLVTITLAGLFDKVIFYSNGQNAFEFDNVSTAVPIPAALPLFAGGVGLLGWLARRKRRAAEALHA